jgi:phosphatidylethanolamine-binding protein
MVDIDVPMNGTRVEVLHWFLSNATLTGTNNQTSLNGTADALYYPPSPPAGDVAHNYNFVLFEQPDDFAVPEQFKGVLETRLFFNTSEFVKAAGLSKPIAANYMQVQNRTGTPTTTFPPPRATNGTSPGVSPSSSTAPFPGGAPAVALGGAFWGGVVAAGMVGIGAFTL